MKEFNLHNYYKKNSFKTPSNYFDNLEDVVMQKLNENEHMPIKTLWQNSGIWFSTIAAIVLVTIGVFYYYEQNSYSKIDTLALESYIISNTTTDEISNQLTDKDIEELSKNIIKQEDIREYVNIDLNYHANWEE